MLRSINFTFPRRNSFPVPKMVTIGESIRQRPCLCLPMACMFAGQQQQARRSSCRMNHSDMSTSPTLQPPSSMLAAAESLYCSLIGKAQRAWESSIWNVRNKLIFNSPLSYSRSLWMPSQSGYHMWMEPWSWQMICAAECGIRMADN